MTFYRGGCIICVDYGLWARRSYPILLLKFNILNDILYEWLSQQIDYRIIDPQRTFAFGFSYGGQLASAIGQRLPAHRQLQKIDRNAMFPNLEFIEFSNQINCCLLLINSRTVCDIAGPGFDYVSVTDHRKSARNVQCYYSSLDKGSHFYRCHQNIRLGQCGFIQPAVLSQPFYSSHGLCVYIYVNAFDFPFYALSQPPVWCGPTTNAARNLSKHFTVGYRETGYE